ncbi:hypothetical protein BC828DRAFT_98793 [Blastocladiella britannica]|nr:hypothetical protein BC828DRAFT_98793 [Blastocladiella britannica]
MDNKNKDDDDAMDVDAISAPPILLPSGPLEVSSSGSDASSEASDNDNNDNDDDASSSDTERPTSAVLAVSGTDDTIDEEDNTDDPMATTAANNPDNTNAAAVVQQPPPLPPPPPPRLLVAESYIYPTTVPLPALLVPGVAASLPGRPSRKAVAINDERAQPRVLHAHRLIRARHGGVLPAEFIVRRPGVDDDDDDDDDDDEDDDDGGSDSDQRTAGSSIGGQLDFFKALESKYANSSSNGKAKKRAPPRKRKDDNEWYDSADPFIDDAGEFDGNLGLMQPVRQGWFMCTGPVEVVPLYDDVVADSDDGGAGLPELAIVAPSISASGSVPAAKATKKQAASFSAEPSPVAAVGAATKRAGDSASAACATSPMAPSAAPTSAPAATTARRGKYMVLRTLDPPTPPGTPSESDREAVFAHLIKYVPTPVVAPLKTFRRLAAAADWTEKKVFPPTLKEPWYNATRAYWDASPTVPSGAFLHAVFVCMPYNLFTVKRYIARNFVERYVEEVVEQVMWVGLLQTMTGCANEVKEFEDERARLAQIAESNGDPQRGTLLHFSFFLCFDSFPM